MEGMEDFSAEKIKEFIDDYDIGESHQTVGWF